MPYRKTDHLIKLISRLTPAEKRQFRIQVNQKNLKGEILFMSLFDFLDKEKSYDEQLILQKIPSIRKNQVSNIKSNLYKQILTSLRTQKRATDPAINLYENIDFAMILLSKGMYHASLSTLDKTKKAALEQENYTALLVILEKEKHIESIYVTGSMYPKAEQLKKETIETLVPINQSHQLSSFSLSLYGVYLQYGYVRDEKDFEFVTDYFKENLPAVNVYDLDFLSKLYFFQSHVWYYNMTHDFANAYGYAQRWLDHFGENPKWSQKKMTQHIKGFHNVLNALFMAQRHDKFKPIYDQLVEFGNANIRSMDRNELSMYKLIEITHGVNQYFLTGDFSEGVEYVKQTEQFLEDNTYDWDLNRIMLFNYKIASIYFCNGELDHANHLLNKITNNVHPGFRQDIQCFARLLNLIVHFDLGNEALVTHQIKSTYRFLSKMDQLQNALIEIMAFLRRIPRIKEEDLKSEFTKLRDELIIIESDKYERRPFLYLDIIAWLDSKIQSIPVGEIIRQKRRVSKK